MPRGVESILARLDTFTAPPTGTEGWDRRKAAAAADPTIGDLIPSKRMMLVRGVCLVIRYRLDGTFKPALAEKSDVSDALKVYESTDEGKTGFIYMDFRSGTHKHFVRALSAADRAKLVEEIVALLRVGRLTPTCE